MCTHKIDIPLNAIVEVVLVDEGECRELFVPLRDRVAKAPLYSSELRSSTAQLEPSVPLARLQLQSDRYWPVARHQREEDQPEARLGPRSSWSAAPSVQSASVQGYYCRAQQRLRRSAVPS